MTNKEKLKLLKTILDDYNAIITELLNNKTTIPKKSLNNAYEGLQKAIEDVLNDVFGIVRKKTIKEEMKEEFEKSPNVIYIKNKEGIYRKYDKINYYARNIIYASYGYGIDLKHFTYKELKDNIKQKKVKLL